MAMASRVEALVFGAVAAAAAAAGCGVDPEGPPERLSAYGLFFDPAAQEPAPGVFAYEVVSPLFSDHTVKRRFLAVPAGERIADHDDAVWEFPQGAIVVKTFAYPVDERDPGAGLRLLETRLLVRDEGTWTPHTYVWNSEQTDAVRTVAGATIAASWIDAGGQVRELEYRVPNVNQCHNCHGEGDGLDLLGVRTRQLNRDGQLERLAERGLLESARPAPERPRLPEPFGDAPVEDRARAYLDVNCGHCHRPGGAAGSTGLDLTWGPRAPIDLGVCRRPFSAGTGAGGRSYDIVPGKPDESVMIFRMESVDPEIKMPEMPTQLSDADGVALVSDWIEAMEPPGCP